MSEYIVTIRRRRSLAQQAAQNPKFEHESVAEPPAKPAVLNAADKKRERKRKAAEEVKEEAEAGDEEEVKQSAADASELPQKTAEKSKRAKRRHRGAAKRQEEGRTREGKPRPEAKEEVEES